MLEVLLTADIISFPVLKENHYHLPIANGSRFSTEDHQSYYVLHVYL